MDALDQTLPVHGGNFQQRVFTGTLRDLYNASKEPQNKKKSLNALYLPNPHALIEECPFATDVRAINRATGQDQHCIRQMPTADTRFGLAATAGGHHFFHIDDRGDGTTVETLIGSKVWYVAELKVKLLETSPSLWTKDNLDVTSLDPSKWNIEGVFLTPGTRL